MDHPDLGAQAVGPTSKAATKGFGTLPVEIVEVIRVLLGNSTDMLRLARVNKHLYHCIVHLAWEHDVKVTGECRCLMGNAELSNIDGMVRAVQAYGVDQHVLRPVSGRHEHAYKASAMGVAIEQMNPLMVRALLDLGCDVEMPSQQFFRGYNSRWDLPSPLLQLLLYSRGTTRLEQHPLRFVERSAQEISALEIGQMDEWCREARQLASVFCEILQTLVDHGASVNAVTTGLSPNLYKDCSPLNIAIISGMPAEVVSLLLSLGASPVPDPRPEHLFDPARLIYYACIWDSLDLNRSLTTPVSTLLFKYEDTGVLFPHPKRPYFNELIRLTVRPRKVSPFVMANLEKQSLFTKIIDREVASMADIPGAPNLLPVARIIPRGAPNLQGQLLQINATAEGKTLLGAWVEVVGYRKDLVEAAKTYISILVGQKGVSPNGPCQHDSNHSPLHRICQWDHDTVDSATVSLLKFFLGLPGVDLEWSDAADSKQTPLHFACRGPIVSEEIIEPLLQAGANPMAEDARGRTPLDVLRESPRMDDDQETLEMFSRVADRLETAMRNRQQ